MKKFPFYRQLDRKDCGPTCLRMVAKHYGKTYSAEYLNKKASIARDGVSLAGIAEAAEDIGMRTAVVSIDINILREDVTLPCIAYWKKKHFVVVYKITKSKIYVSDPAFGKIIYTDKDFLKGWLYNRGRTDNDEGFIMLIEPSPTFYEKKQTSAIVKSKGLSFLIPYIAPHKKVWVQLIIGLLLVSFFQLLFPFLTQSIVDVGISNQNLNFIYIILLAQIMLIFSQTSVQVIRDWLLLYVTNKININLISDYLIKLMRLPMAYYDTKNVGDIMQRIQDNNRVQSFLSATSLNVLFSSFTFFIFSIILFYYNTKIFLVFIIGSVLYFIWSLFFMKKRAEIDYRRFDQASGNQTSLLQLITGMSEIRLNGSERKRRWEWEDIQIRLFKLSMQGLAITQTQQTGGVFINEIKNIIITFLSASLVIGGELTLGMMLSIQYIIGQLNVPVSNFVSFIQSAQDARLSIKRLEEAYAVEDEEKENMIKTDLNDDIIINNLSFRYGEKTNPLVLKNLSAKIKKGKITAIVGTSGSGKTTLLKLLLGFYDTYEGDISSGNTNLKLVSPKAWRQNIGVVMQEGYIFSGSIESNLTESDSFQLVDQDRMVKAAKIANIHEFIDSLAMGYDTGIGRSGMGLSGGQRQRMFIARAVYKDPDYLFFDEATSSLDANNEKIIMTNLYNFFEGKTVIIIAHRLSTVKNADNIIVLEGGEIIEEGNHEHLVAQKGRYFELIKNQLELG